MCFNKVNRHFLSIQRLGTDELADLFDDLKVQDKLEMDLKKKRIEDRDEDGEYEALVRRKFLGKSRGGGVTDPEKYE